MNICLLFVCMTVLPVIAGHGVLAVLYRRQAGKIHIAESFIVGWLVTIGLAEGAHLAAVFFGWQFSKVTRIWAAVYLAVVCVCGIVGQVLPKMTERKHKRGTPLRFGIFLVFVLLVIFQIMTIMSQESVYRTGDMTVETVESFLKTDAVYAVNPLTGRAYESGIPLRIRILGLPTLYGMLCSLFGVAGVDLVWRYIPVVVLFLSYSAFLLMGRALFDGEKERDKRLLFMAFVALVFCVGDYGLGMDGFGILHCGFRGVAIRNLVLVPYAFSLALRHKWRPAVLVVLAEACIAWTLYGLGASLLVLLGMGAIRLWQRRRREQKWQTVERHSERGGV